MMTKVKSDPRKRESGSALVAALVGSVLLAGIGLALAGLVSVEASIASNHRAGSQARFAAEGALELVLADLLSSSSWSAILGGGIGSRLQGSASPPVSAGEAPVSLAQLTAALQTRRDSAGTWGANTPQWRLFAYGWLTEIAPAAADSDEYLTAWVADDPEEADNDPYVDSNGRIQIVTRATSFRGIARTIEAVVEQTSGLTASGRPAVRVLAWREIR